MSPLTFVIAMVVVVILLFAATFVYSIVTVGARGRSLCLGCGVELVEGLDECDGCRRRRIEAKVRQHYASAKKAGS